MSSRIHHGEMSANEHANLFIDTDAANVQSPFDDTGAQLSRSPPQQHARRDARPAVTSFLHPNIGQNHERSGSTGGRLIVVSNRVALPKDIRAGGLASALKGALAERGGIWFGWSGRDRRAKPRFDVQKDPVYPIKYATLDLNREDYEGYYTGFCEPRAVAAVPLSLAPARFHSRDARGLSPRQREVRRQTRAARSNPTTRSGCTTIISFRSAPRCVRAASPAASVSSCTRRWRRRSCWRRCRIIAI